MENSLINKGSISGVTLRSSNGATSILIGHEHNNSTPTVKEHIVKQANTEDSEQSVSLSVYSKLTQLHSRILGVNTDAENAW